MKKNKIGFIRSALFVTLILCLGLGGGYLFAKSKNNNLWYSRPKNKPAPVIKAYDFSDLVTRVTPAVFNLQVSIGGAVALKKRQPSQPYGRNPYGRNPYNGRRPNFRNPYSNGPFGRYFRGRKRVKRSRGSGFLINEKGFALTNFHVIKNASQVKATLADGRQFQVKIIGRSPELDLALIRLIAPRSTHFPYVYLGDSNKMRVGEPVIAIGNARGLGISVTAGIISAKGRVIRSGNYDNFIQTDAAINHGNSGGPLFNRNGEVIGINTAILRKGRGIGFSIPINIVRRVLPQLKKRGKIRRAKLGVQIQKVSERLAKSFGLARPRGALVAHVEPGSPAAKAGLRAGDIILRFSGSLVKDHQHLPRLIAFHKAGVQSTITILRNGKKLKRNVRLQTWGMANRYKRPAKLRKVVPKANASRLGVSVKVVGAALRARLRLPRSGGLEVLSVVPGSVAEANGIQRGDVILEMNRSVIQSVRQFGSLIRKIRKGGNILMLIRRGNRSLFLAFTLKK